MNTNEKIWLEELAHVARECICYVGAANFPERERHAARVLSKAFVAFSRGDFNNIKWFEDTSDEDYQNSPD